MKLRAALAVLVAIFDRPAFNDAPQIAAPTARVQEHDGLVSEASAFRIRTAFARFQAFMLRGGG